jgi:predicted small lipoprotein YifL
MKKIIAMLLALSMMTAFTACGDDKEKDSTDTQNSTAENADADSGDGAEADSGELFDAGNVNVMVPAGWKAFPVSDIFSEEENATDPDGIQVAKGAESEWDLLSKPYLDIDFYDADTSGLLTPDKEWYDNAADISPLTTGDLTWEGFSAVSFEMPMTIIWTTDSEGNQYQVTIWTEMTDGNISLDDADVQAILASLSPSA